MPNDTNKANNAATKSEKPHKVKFAFSYSLFKPDEKSDVEYSIEELRARYYRARDAERAAMRQEIEGPCRQQIEQLTDENRRWKTGLAVGYCRAR